MGAVIASWLITGDVMRVSFTPEIAGKSNIWGYIDLSGEFQALAEGGEDTSIILGTQTVTITREPPSSEIGITKTVGEYNPVKNELTWTVTIKTPPSGSPANFKGYKLEDVLSGNHVYKSGSFTVGGNSVPDTAPGLVLDPLTDAKKITYTFPDDTLDGDVTVTYKTTPN
ncbi:MAG: hypothetical protein AAGU32_20635, partial [Bacillota bacterium]